MADSTPTATPSKDTVAESSSFQRTVSLHDWWLIKAQNDFQGKRLAVAGSSRKEGARRLFVSAPVVKRYDVFSLETADGIYVNINGFINEQRTLENGFDPEVFNHFLFGFPPNWESYALDCFRGESTVIIESGTAFPDNATPARPEILSDGTEKSIPTSLASSEEARGDCEKPFPEVECNMLKGMGGVNVAHDSGGNRRRTRLQNIKVCQQQKQPASGGPPKHPDKEQSSTSVVAENHDGEGMKSYGLGCFREESTGGIDSGTVVPDYASAIHPEISSEGMEKSIPTSLLSPEEAPGDCEKPFSEDGCNVSKEKGVINVAYSSGGNRRSARLHNIEVCQQKKQFASGGPLKHLDKEQSFTSAVLENLDGEGLKSPVTPIQSQSKGLVNTLSEQLVKKSASRISRTLSTKTKGCCKKKTVTVKTKAVVPKRKMTKSASAVKSSRERDLSHLNKGSEQKISSVSPESLSFKKSRSGRLLLPPLEFWRNQIPVYNADHEVTEIQEGAPLVSPCCSPLLSRFNNQEHAA